MDVIKGVLGWFGRKGLLFVALVAALIAYQLLSPSYTTYREMTTTVATLQSGGADLARHARTAIDASNRKVADAQRLSSMQLRQSIAQETAAFKRSASACGADLSAAIKDGAKGVIANRRTCIAASIHQRNAQVLTELRETIGMRRPGETFAEAVHRHTDVMRRADALNKTALREIGKRSGNVVDRFRNREQIARLTATANKTAVRYASSKRSAQRLLQAEGVTSAANARAVDAVALARTQFDTFVKSKANELGGTLIGRARGFADRVGLAAKAWIILYALLLITFTPFLIRLLCFYVLAPIAMRRAAIRVGVPGGRGAAIPLPGRSTTSVAVRLAPGEELLVRQDYLQSTSHSGAKGTQWFVDWRKPVTSLATGLTFLTRIRGDGGVTTVSAVRDALAEVMILTLPEGASGVLQPRALAAVAQPIGQRLRITAHWRLASLNAWLTLQLRYLVFHGPVRLVLKGGRGIRVERAERGRVFGQDQLVGFSADLAYSVTRTETVWPYLLGRETLLKDRVEAGDGVLIVEEAPLAGAGREVRRGLEGMIDAGMKVFGM